MVGRLIVREAESPRRQSTGEDLILVPVAIHQIDIEAVNIATDDMASIIPEVDRDHTLEQ